MKKRERQLYHGVAKPNPLVSYHIDLDVPAPVAPLVPRIPFEDMPDGSSVFIPEDALPWESVVITVRRANQQIAKEFTAYRWENPDGIKGVRIWRLKHRKYSFEISDQIDMPLEAMVKNHRGAGEQISVFDALHQVILDMAPNWREGQGILIPRQVTIDPRGRDRGLLGHVRAWERETGFRFHTRKGDGGIWLWRIG